MRRRPATGIPLIACLLLLPSCGSEGGDDCAELEREWRDDADARSPAEWTEAFEAAGCEDALFFEL